MIELTVVSRNNTHLSIEVDAEAGQEQLKMGVCELM
jgi:hypothetical protein